MRRLESNPSNTICPQLTTTALALYLAHRSGEGIPYMWHYSRGTSRRTNTVVDIRIAALSVDIRRVVLQQRTLQRLERVLQLHAGLLRLHHLDHSNALHQCGQLYPVLISVQSAHQCPQLLNLVRAQRTRRRRHRMSRLRHRIAGTIRARRRRRIESWIREIRRRTLRGIRSHITDIAKGIELQGIRAPRTIRVLHRDHWYTLIHIYRLDLRRNGLRSSKGVAWISRILHHVLYRDLHRDLRRVLH